MQGVQWLLLLTGGLYGAQLRNKTGEPVRQERTFSLFSIVQFPNQACSSTSGTYGNGTCFTANECSANGGTAQGNCAAGFGVCCVFSVSASGSSVSQNCSYIVNPSYPSNYAPTAIPTTLTYTINKVSSDVCRIRLDYDQFVLDGPVALGGNVATTGQCSTDRFTMVTTDRQSVPTTGAPGTYGQYPYLCGTNSGYHSYLDMSCTSTDTATLSFVINSNTNNQWKIKVTQYSCGDPGVASQQGCFQYHTGVSGTLQSYNFAGGVQLASQHYKNCIRQEAGYCCIQYTVQSYSISPQDCSANDANRCSGASVCSMDFIIIPGASANPTAMGDAVNYERFCGANLNPLGYIANNAPVLSCQCPFELDHVTAITALNGNAIASAGAGFQITYSQIPGHC